MNKYLNYVTKTTAGSGMTILRVILGITFMMHGAQKLFGMFGGGGLDGTTKFMASLGLEPASLMAFMAGLGEFGGGLLLLLGLFTRLGALGTAIVSLVAILDADKEGMLRSRRSMIQTVGRAARNINGRAIMYADKITKSMQAALDETEYRRNKQIEYNQKNGQVPTALNKKISENLVGRSKDFPDEKYTQKEITQKVAETKSNYSSEDVAKIVQQKQKEMEAAAKNLDFIKAAKLRDEIEALKN